MENPIFKLAIVFFLANLDFFFANSSAWALGSSCNLKKYLLKQLFVPKVIYLNPIFFSYLELSTIFLKINVLFSMFKFSYLSNKRVGYING